MKKNDWKIVIGVLAVAVIGFIIAAFMKQGDASIVTVRVDGNVFGTYDLMKNQTIKIHDTNVFEIKDGHANMISADCPDKLCVKQTTISKKNETIVCLPNKVILEVTSAEEGVLDSMTN